MSKILQNTNIKSDIDEYFRIKEKEFNEKLESGFDYYLSKTKDELTTKIDSYNKITRENYLKEIENNVNIINKYSKDAINNLKNNFSGVLNKIKSSFNNKELVVDDWSIRSLDDSLNFIKNNKNYFSLSRVSFFAVEGGTGSGYFGANKIGKKLKYDTSFCYNIDKRRFTAPIDGDYLFIAGASKYLKGDLSLRLYVNGKIYNEIITEGTTGFNTHTIQSYCNLSQGDYVEVYAKGNTWFNSEFNHYNWFGGKLIG